MLDFEVARDKDGSVMHDLVNATFGRKEPVPHEWYFLCVLGREEILNNKDVADAFVMFVMQYYPHYQFHFFKPDDYLETVVCECELNAFCFQNYDLGFYLDANKEYYLAKAMMFGDIVTDFLIRYRNYSLIKCSGQNIILTAQSDCHKRFEKYLSQGYALQRRAKVRFIKKPKIKDELVLLYKGLFYKLPVLPTRDIGYPIDEIIETATGEYKQVMQLTENYDNDICNCASLQRARKI